MKSWPKNPGAYAKAIAPAAAGIVLIVGGHLIHDTTLVGMGYGAIAAALAILGIPNQAPR